MNSDTPTNPPTTAPPAVDTLIECFRSSREEIMARTKTRDAYIKLQLLVQAVLMALMEGVTLGGVQATKAIPQVTLLAVPASTIFWLLYFTDDRLCAQLGSYSRRVLGEIQRIHGHTPVLCWDGSEEVIGYLKVRIITRYCVSLIVFCLVPALLLLAFIGQQHTVPYADVITYLEWFGVLVIFALVTVDFSYRRKRKIDIRNDIHQLIREVELSQLASSKSPSGKHPAPQQS